MAADPVVRDSVAVADPNAPSHVLKPNADGSLNVSGTISANTSANATAAAPSYTEGTENPLSQTLAGALRTSLTTALPAGSNVIGHVIGDSGSTTAVTGNVAVVQPTAASLNATVVGTGTFAVQATSVKSTTFTASQVTVPATANGILLLALNTNRLGATISNPGSVPVYISSASTGLTTSNGFAIPGGSSYNITTPLYTGALYGIISTSTQVVTIVELT